MAVDTGQHVLQDDRIGVRSRETVAPGVIGVVVATSGLNLQVFDDTIYLRVILVALVTSIMVGPVLVHTTRRPVGHLRWDRPTGTAPASEGDSIAFFRLG
ncbi:hypothetical protein ACPXCG_22365 [Gordonia sp. DT218]|uniref:hypothetical protein n=1 Tax=Gordonia sp. DT218 TaxID=3416659 RepID=UPI003CF313D3